MAEENDTNVSDDTDVSGNTNDKSDNTGSDTDNTQKNQEKTLTQTEVNSLLKHKQAEWRTKYLKEFEKTLEGKQVLSDDELKKLRTDIETNVKQSIALETKRAEYKAKGLSDVQLDTVQVDKIEDYEKRVNELFGALLKKDAPVLNGGNSNKDSDSNDTNRALNEKLRNSLTRRKI